MNKKLAGNLHQIVIISCTAPNWLLPMLFFTSFFEIAVFTTPGVVAAEGGETAAATNHASQRLLSFFFFAAAAAACYDFAMI